METNHFETLFSVNVNDKVEQKNGLNYLSWSYAWAEVKKRFPEAHYTIWKNEAGLPYTVDPMTGYMVYTSVTIDGITHEMWLPVMDGANKAMRPEAYEYSTKYGKKRCEAATMMDINKTIMRCLVKNLAMFGLGLYIYAGEDLPETENDQKQEQKQTQKQEQKSAPKPAESPAKPAAATLSAKVPDLNPVGAYITREIKAMAERYGAGFNFVAVRKELIDIGLLQNIPSKDMTMDQAVQMVETIFNYMDSQREAV